MPKYDFFSRLGMLTIKDFFDAETCAQLRDEARSSPSIEASIRKKGTAAYTVDESVRRTKVAKVSAQTVAFVKDRLLALMPQVESHFAVTLRGCEEPQFLVYKEGDYFQRHNDSSTKPDTPAYLKDRRVSLSIFLNGESPTPAPDSFCDGGLVFYGLVDDPRMKLYGFPLIGETGLLVAFRSHSFHEVKSITHGERYTIVNWYY